MSEENAEERKVTEGDWESVAAGSGVAVEDDTREADETPTGTSDEQPPAKPEDATSGQDGKPPEEGKGEEPPKPGAEQPPATGFDKTIQPVLQQAANERKSLQAQLTGKDEAIERLTTELAQAKSGQPLPSDEDAEKIDKLFASLDGMADGTQVVGALKALHARFKSLGQTKGDDPRIAALETELGELKASAGVTTGNAALAATLTALDTKYKAAQGVRDQAVKEVFQYFSELGFTEHNPPSAEATVLAYENAYMRITQAAGTKADPPPKNEPGIKTDPGTGGKTATGGKKEKTYEETLQDMEGKPWQYEEPETG